ncbi:MAG: hypothetical protein ACRD2J_11895 [Thermoanaerobaculia bacterium]
MRTSILLLAIGAALAAGCDGREEPAEPVATGTADTAVTTTDAVLDPEAVKLALEDPVPVSITDSAVTIEGEDLIPGPTEFQVTNDGSQVYSLVIEGPGGRTAIEAPLQPLETRTVTVELQPGTWRASVPEAAALTAEFTVAAPEAEETTTTGTTTTGT